MTEIETIKASHFPQEGIFVYTIGYESRSSFYFKSQEIESYQKIIAFDYGEGSTGLHSYDDNLKLAASNGVESFDRIDNLCAAIGDSLPVGGGLVTIDITSLDREKMAYLIKFLFQIHERLAAVRLVYCPSQYQEPHFSLGAVRSFGPVIPAFAGDVVEPRRRLALLVGFGYEYGRTVGAIESLEPDKIHGFMPVGTDPCFETKIVENNLHFEFLGRNDILKKYHLKDPRQIYTVVRSAVELELAKRSVLILPMGPKIFAAISIVIAMIRHPSVMVWRYSSTSARRPETTTDALASGLVCEFPFKFVDNNSSRI